VVVINPEDNTGRDHWALRQRFNHDEYVSLLGALNHYVLRWTPWRLAWRQDEDTGQRLGWDWVRYSVRKTPVDTDAQGRPL
tara:strand:+ start:230 stop:472 length:243 start_codon:yes stop_codon:yes gene_type:complete